MTEIALQILNDTLRLSFYKQVRGYEVLNSFVYELQMPL